MQLWGQIRYRLRCLFRPAQLDAEMAEELTQHLELRVQANLAAGLAAPEARALAVRQFGGIERLKETARQQRAFAWLMDAVRDFGFGLRQLRRTPTMAVTAVVSLALGLGATTAIYSVTRGVIFRPLPFPHAEELVTLRETFLPRFPQAGVSPGVFNLWRQNRAQFQQIAAWDYSYYQVTGLDHPQRRFALRVTAEFLATYQVAPVLGRDFGPADEAEGAGPVVIIGHALWLQQFGGRPDVIGRQLMLDGRLHTIIGVAPASFPPANYTVDLFVPRHFSPEELANFSDHDLDVVARLAPGVDAGAAQQRLADDARALGRLRPGTNRGWGVAVTSLQSDTTSGWRIELFTLMAAVGLLLLIACVNVANLLLARACSRRHEMAVRAALGAGRLRIFRQMISESLALATLGGTLGVALAFGGTRLLLALAPNWLPRIGEISLDGPVLLFAALATLGTGLAFGLVPAIYACRVELNDNLKGVLDAEAAPSRPGRLIGAMVVAEVALATTLLFAAALLVKSVHELSPADPGPRNAEVYFAAFNLPPERFADGRERREFVDSLTGVLRHQSGIDGVGVVSRFVVSAATVPSHALGPVAVASASPGYFSAMGIPPLVGREFADAVAPSGPLEVVVDADLARQLAPDGDAVGRTLRLEFLPGRDAVVVGVVGPVRPGLGDEVAMPRVYVPFQAAPAQSFFLVVHSPRTPLDLTRTVRSAVAAVESHVAVDHLHYLPGALHASLRIHRYVTTLFVVFAVIALLLAAAGVYGVMAYSVAQRTNEFGIRVALGAHRRDVILMVMREGAHLLLLGLVCGGVGALGVSRLISFVLFNVRPYDVQTLGAVSLLLGAIGLLACWGPAWRATTVEPATALRLE